MEVERRNPKRKPLSDRTNFDSITTLHQTSKKNKKRKPLLLLDSNTRIPRQPPEKKPSENWSSVNDDTSTGSNVPPSHQTTTSTPHKSLVSDSVTINIENSEAPEVYHKQRSVGRSKDKGKQVMEIVSFSCPQAGRIRNIGSNVAPSRTTSTPPPLPQKSLDNSDAFHSENSEALTVYHRRHAVDRSKEKGKQDMDIVPFSCPPAGRIRNIGDVLITERGDATKLKKGRNDAFHFNMNPRANKKKRLFSTPEQHTLPQDFIDKQRAYFAEVDAFELVEEEASEGEMEELNRATSALATDSANQ
ncbi:hypothetical protein Sjap_014285 [Stephania japonica]|uniref:Sororin C-terminal region domain-containing protein n=1 Tax=Stephania japonica TaxID=461633 RepID=A0AAP0J1D4_9MAGN